MYRMSQVSCREATLTNRVTLYGATGPLKQWIVTAHIYPRMDGTLEFKDAEGRDITLRGTYTVEQDSVPVDTKSKKK